MEHYEFYTNQLKRPNLQKLFGKKKKYRLVYRPGQAVIEILGRGSYKFCQYRKKVCKESGNYPAEHLKIVPDGASKD